MDVHALIGHRRRLIGLLALFAAIIAGLVPIRRECRAPRTYWSQQLTEFSHPRW